MLAGAMLLICATVWDTGGLFSPDAVARVAAQSPDTTAAGREAHIQEHILLVLGTQGYLEARFETLTASPGTFTLVPGRRFSIERVVVDGPTDIASRARSRVEGLAGHPWDAAAVRAQLDALVRAHEEEGYPFVHLAVRHAAADSVTGGVRLRIGVTPGPRVVVDRVEVPDTIRTKARVAARLAGIRPGALYRQSDVDRAVSRLRETRYFRSIGRPTLAAGPAPDRVVLRLHLVERTPHAIRGALGFSRDGTVVGSLEATLRNIAGTAREAAFRWERRGEGRTDLSLNYREPWILGLPPSLELSVRQTVEDTLWVEREGTVGFGWDLGRGFLGSIGYRGRRVIPGEGIDLVSASRTDEAWGRGVWDRENSDTLPARGYWVAFRAGYQELKDLDAGGEIPVVRLEIQGRRAVRLGIRYALVLSMTGMHAIHAAEELPLSELFVVGGARTIRGYREAQFRTESAGWCTLQLHLGSDGSSSLFLFVDAGAYDRGPNYEGLLGMGGGLMASTAIGVINLAYGVPRGSDLLQGRIHVSAGGKF